MSSKKYVLVTTFGQVPIDDAQYGIVKKFQGKKDNVWVSLSDETGLYQKAIMGVFLNQEWVKEQEEMALAAMKKQTEALEDEKAAKEDGKE